MKVFMLSSISTVITLALCVAFAQGMLYTGIPGVYNLSTGNSWILPKDTYPVFYRHFRDRISWIEADAVCQFHHGQLAIADSDEQYNAVNGYLRDMDITDYVWIGLKRTGSSGPFLWNGKENLTASEQRWKQKIPQSDNSLCVITDPAFDFKWKALECNGPAAATFVCELDVPDWAKGDGICRINTTRSVNMSFLPMQSAVQLSVDCGLEGTKEVICNDEMDRAKIILEATCPVSNNTLSQNGTGIINIPTEQPVMNITVSEKEIISNYEYNTIPVNDSDVNATDINVVNTDTYLINADESNDVSMPTVILPEEMSVAEEPIKSSMDIPPVVVVVLDPKKNPDVVTTTVVTTTNENGLSPTTEKSTDVKSTTGKSIGDIVWPLLSTTFRASTLTTYGTSSSSSAAVASAAATSTTATITTTGNAAPTTTTSGTSANLAMEAIAPTLLLFEGKIDTAAAAAVKIVSTYNYVKPEVVPTTTEQPYILEVNNEINVYLDNTTDDQISLQESHELFNAGKICLNESAAAAVEKEMPSSLVKKSAEQNSSSVVVIKKVELNSGENSEVTMSADKTAFLEGTLEVEQQMEKTRPINVYKKIEIKPLNGGNKVADRTEESSTTAALAELTDQKKIVTNQTLDANQLSSSTELLLTATTETAVLIGIQEITNNTTVTAKMFGTTKDDNDDKLNATTKMPEFATLQITAGDRFLNESKTITSVAAQRNDSAFSIPTITSSVSVINDSSSPIVSDDDVAEELAVDKDSPLLSGNMDESADVLQNGRKRKLYGKRHNSYPYFLGRILG